VQAILQKGSDETVSAKQSQNEKLSKPSASACSHRANKKETEVHLLLIAPSPVKLVRSYIGF